MAKNAIEPIPIGLRLTGDTARRFSEQFEKRKRQRVEPERLTKSGYGLWLLKLGLDVAEKRGHLPPGVAR